MDPDSGSDVDEDAEAKLLRLRQAAGKSKNSGEDAAPTALQIARQKPTRGRKAKQKGGKAAAEERDDEWQGIVAATDSPTSIDIDVPDRLPNSKASNISVADQSAQPSEQNGSAAKPSAAQLILQSRAEILTPQAGRQNGKAAPKSAGKRKQVSIGPLLRTATAQNENSEVPEILPEENQAAQPPFIKSKAFSGEKVGYRFGKGKSGVGYYLDKGAKASSNPDAKRRRVDTEKPEEGAEIDDVLEDIATGNGAQHAVDAGAETGEV